MRGRCWIAVAAVACCVAGAAKAEPGLANTVYAPYVKKGVTELELRGGRLNGGPLEGESAAVVELEYGVNDRLSLAVLAEFERHAGETSKLDAVAVEGVVYLGQIPGLGVDVGGDLEYEQRIHNESGVLENKLLLAKQAAPFHALLNLIARRALTNRPGQDDTAFGYAAQGTIDVNPRVQIGLQAFGDLGTNRNLGGRQSHYVGPVAKWEVRPAGGHGELEIETAYLLPVSAARGSTDGQFRLMIAYERRF